MPSAVFFVVLETLRSRNRPVRVEGNIEPETTSCYYSYFGYNSYYMITTTFSAKEGKNNFGRLLDEARVSPVAIEKNGRRVAVIISSDEYDEFEARRDAAWGTQAEAAHKKGYVGNEKSTALLKEALDARD